MIKVPNSSVFHLLCGLSLALLSGCVYVPQAFRYAGPKERPAALDEYYSRGESFHDFNEEVLENKRKYTIKRIQLATDAGLVTIDYFQRKASSDDLIFIFPVLGGRHMFELYFADYFARRGYDTAIVHRDGEFRKVENVDNLEEIFRNAVVRDRIAMDYFEKRYGKRDFGSFGISRGGINAAMTAGVDPRLKYNVIVMGGSNLVKILRDSDERGVRKYRKQVKSYKGINEEQFYTLLNASLKTDPSAVARYIDARNTLMFLSVFDRSVPVRYGMELREGIGEPGTFFLLSGHYTSLLYTQFVRMEVPGVDLTVFPMDYVESESLSFYNRSFKPGRAKIKELPLTILKLPFQVFGRVLQLFF